jgi:hypothetical protein
MVMKDILYSMFVGAAIIVAAMMFICLICLFSFLVGVHPMAGWIIMGLFAWVAMTGIIYVARTL